MEGSFCPSMVPTVMHCFLMYTLGEDWLGGSREAGVQVREGNKGVATITDLVIAASVASTILKLHNCGSLG